jgi:hypothetical protein
MRTDKEIELLAWQWIADNSPIEAEIDVFQAFYWGVKAGQSHWIAVSDYLPEIGKDVLTYDKWGDFFKLSFITEKGKWAYDEQGNTPDPSHWCHLPEKPKK